MSIRILPRSDARLKVAVIPDVERGLDRRIGADNKKSASCLDSAGITPVAAQLHSTIRWWDFNTLPPVLLCLGSRPGMTISGVLQPAQIDGPVNYNVLDLHLTTKKCALAPAECERTGLWEDA